MAILRCHYWAHHSLLSGPQIVTFISYAKYIPTALWISTYQSINSRTKISPKSHQLKSSKSQHPNNLKYEGGIVCDPSWGLFKKNPQPRMYFLLIPLVERSGEREKHYCESMTLICCLLNEPWPGWNPPPGYVPRLGTESETLWCTGNGLTAEADWPAGPTLSPSVSLWN